LFYFHTVTRRLVGSSSTRVLPVAALLSACFLIVIDTLARTLTGAELPLGIFTGFLGAPFFAFILVRERMAD
jgi:iron complex transport system permease protein